MAKGKKPASIPNQQEEASTTGAARGKAQTPLGAAQAERGFEKRKRLKAGERAAPISHMRFKKTAVPVTVQVNGQILAGVPKMFSTGSFGWYCSDKVVLSVDGVPMRVQANITLTVVGSKNADPPDDTQSGRNMGVPSERIPADFVGAALDEEEDGIIEEREVTDDEVEGRKAQEHGEESEDADD